MKRTSLRSKDIEKEATLFEIPISKRDIVERLENGINVVLINKKPTLFEFMGKMYPTLRYLLEHPCLKKVVVDMGAVKFMVNGADVMRPGIVDVDEGIAPDEVVVIVDVTHRKPLAVGQALLSGEKIKAASFGKMIKNIHFVGDAIWNLEV